MKNRGDKKYWKKEAWRLCSLYIRQRDDKKGCITCGRHENWRYMDAGHFISREHELTFLDEKNINAQCKQCNMYKSGKQYEHGLMIDKKYGKGTAEQLLLSSKIQCKRTWFDYWAIAEEYREKLIHNGFQIR